MVDLLVQHNVRARSAQDADVCSDGVPGQCLEAALLHHLGTLGPVRQQQFLLTQLPHWTKAKADEVSVIAYVRGISSTNALCAPVATFNSRQPLLDLLVQHHLSVRGVPKMQTSCIDAVPAQCLEAAVLHHLGTLGPAWERQSYTELAQLPHWTKAEADEVSVIAYVRGVSSTGAAEPWQPWWTCWSSILYPCEECPSCRRLQ